MKNWLSKKKQSKKTCFFVAPFYAFCGKTDKESTIASPYRVLELFTAKRTRKNDEKCQKIMFFSIIVLVFRIRTRAPMSS